MRCALLAFLVVALGCDRPAPVVPASVVEVEGDDPGFPVAEHSLPMTSGTTASERLLAEAVRQLRAMKSTRYRHKTKIDESEGRFEYDCSGFVAYALANAAPDALALVPIGVKGRPRAEDFTRYFASLDATTNAHWSRVSRASDVRPGDVIAWLRPGDVDNTNTGHVVIAYAAPKPAPFSSAIAAIGGRGEILLRVVDSTESPHADDVRGPDTTTGLGTGTIGLVIDEAGAPIGYRWRGGESPKAHATLVAIARVL